MHMESVTNRHHNESKEEPNDIYMLFNNFIWSQLGGISLDLQQDCGTIDNGGLAVTY